MSRLRSSLLVMLSASALGLAACGNSSATTATMAPPQASSTTTSTSAASGSSLTIASIPAKDRSPAGTAGKAPTVVVPSGSPPAGLESADLIVGKGAVAKAEPDSVEVEYVLATYSSRKVIQSSWTSQPFGFTLGEGQVIPGWDEGVMGMRAGGRRELIIPPSLGYGSRTPGAGIAANDTLVFVIDLLNVG
jgi:peptidylprolyl isomerase